MIIEYYCKGIFRLNIPRKNPIDHHKNYESIKFHPF